METEEIARHLLCDSKCENCLYVNNRSPKGFFCMLLGTKHYDMDDTIDNFCNNYVHISVRERFNFPSLVTYRDIDNLATLVEANK